MNPNPDPLTLRARSTEDLIAAAPILIGYEPEHAIVMISAAGRHVFHGCSALPGPADPVAAAAEVADNFLVPARRNGIRSVVFLFFSDDARVVRRVWGTLRRGCEEVRLQVLDAARIDSRRYYPLCGDRRLREIGIEYDVAAHPFRAEAVSRGLVVERNRAAVVASVAPDHPAQQAVQAAAAGRGLAERPPPSTDAERRLWGRLVRDIVAEHAGAATLASDDEVATIGWAAQDLRVRDAAWSLITRPDAERHQRFWLDVTRRVPDALVLAPAALLGWAAWQAGHGALAWIAVDRCREVAPHYGLAAILARCLEEALPPDTLDLDFRWDEGLPA